MGSTPSLGRAKPCTVVKKDEARNVEDDLSRTVVILKAEGPLALKAAGSGRIPDSFCSPFPNWRGGKGDRTAAFDFFLVPLPTMGRG